MQYILLTVATLFLALNFALNKIYQREEGDSLKAGLAFNSLSGLFTIAVFYAINGFKMEFTTFSFIMAILVNGVTVGYTLLGFMLLKSGSMALYTLFLMTGGMTVPYIWGLLFLDEPFSVLRTAGLMLILIGVILSNFSGEKINFKQVLMCVAVFVINGFGSVFAKIHQIETVFACVNELEFIILGGMFRFIFCGTLYFLMKNSGVEQRKNKIHYKSWLIIALSAILSGGSTFLLLVGAVSLPATVLYPFTTGGTIVFSALAGRMFFKEKLSYKLILSVILCFAGTLMFL